MIRYWLAVSTLMLLEHSVLTLSTVGALSCNDSLPVLCWLLAVRRTYRTGLTRRVDPISSPVAGTITLRF